MSQQIFILQNFSLQVTRGNYEDGI